MTPEQIQAEKIVKILAGAATFGCLVLIVASSALMIGQAWANPNPILTNLYLGLFGSMLIFAARTGIEIAGYKPSSFVWGVIRSTVTRIHSGLVELRSRTIEATDWSFLDPDILLLSTGKGEISELITTSPVQLVIPPKPSPVPTVDLGPGFIYVMRRADGVYKLGRAIDPTRRLLDHQSAYKQDFKLVRCFAVSDMVAFERAALSMTKLYAYKKEAGRKELRKMTKKQLYHFLAEFGELVSIGTIKNIKKATEVATNGRVSQ